MLSNRILAAWFYGRSAGLIGPIQHDLRNWLLMGHVTASFWRGTDWKAPGRDGLKKRIWANWLESSSPLPVLVPSWLCNLSAKVEGGLLKMANYSERLKPERENIWFRNKVCQKKHCFTIGRACAIDRCGYPLCSYLLSVNLGAHQISAIKSHLPLL